MTNYDLYITTDPMEADNEDIQARFDNWLNNQGIEELQEYLNWSDRDLLEATNRMTEDEAVEYIKTEFNDDLQIYFIENIL